MLRQFISLFFTCAFATATGFAQASTLLSRTTVDLHQENFWKNITEQGSLKPDYRYLNTLDFYKISYLSDSIAVDGFMMEPRKTGKYPLIIFNRGGNRDFAPLSVGTLINYAAALAASGYVVIASCYRAQDEFGGRELDDVLNLLPLATQFEKADTSAIGMLGWSRGGMMTYLALRHSGRIKTAVAGNAPTDLFKVIEERPEMETKVFAQCIPDYANNKDRELKRRSVVYWADELDKNSSLLILTGTRDSSVNPQQADELAKLLYRINYDFELKKFDTDHYFSGSKALLDETLIRWFDSKLKHRR